MKDISFSEYDLPYVISIKGKVIGAFQNSIDRDDCMSFLQERYEDVKFTAINLEE
jgi:hypothetical protein